MAKNKNNQSSGNETTKSGRIVIGKQKKTVGKTRKKGSWKWRAFKFCFKIGASFVAIGLILAFMLVAFYAHDLPDIDDLYKDELKPSITILDTNDNVIGTYGDVFTEFVSAKEMPDTLKNAVIATEDRRFYDHWGVDMRGLARAMVMNTIKGRVVQGGSTLSQQLAKIVFLKPERHLKRKIQEAIMAVWLERRFDKDQILTMYLNRVYLGGGVYGMDAAARKYFGKSVKKLNLYESAMLAGLLKAPTTYSPQNNLRAAQRRTKQVLLNMVDAEIISKSEMNQALMTGAKINLFAGRDSNRYYADYVVDQLPKYIEKVNGNLIVTTTFQPGMQKFAEDALIQNILTNGKKYHVQQGAIVAMKPTGEVLAIVGGVDYSDSQFNRATQAQRQPGSLFKFFVYLQAFLDGKSPDSKIEDEPITLRDTGARKNWTPKNYDQKYHGIVTLREAFAHSYNVAAVVLSETTGRNKIIDLAYKLGIDSDLENSPSLALGASEVNLLEITGAYAHIANKGRAVHPFVIEQIRNRKGDILYQHKGEEQRQILSTNAVKMMNDIMSSVMRYGTGRSANIGRDAAGKTGTSQDSRDAWFIGYTPQVVAGVWVGNDDGAAMKKVTGGMIPAKIWHDFMMHATEQYPPAKIETNPFPEIEGTPWERENFWGNLIGN